MSKKSIMVEMENGLQEVGVFHGDHGLTDEHWRLVEIQLAGWDGSFRMEVIDFGEELPALTSGLYGPVEGDEAISENEVVYQKRGDRNNYSRMIDRPGRPVQKLVLIVGSNKGKPTVFTCYGGNTIAPREPSETMSPEEYNESRKFWNQHALSLHC